MVPMIVCYGYFPQGPHVSCYGSVQGSAASLQLIFVELIIRFRNSGGATNYKCIWGPRVFVESSRKIKIIPEQ